MKAMILAAGLGTRLRPWTLTHPKALVPVKGIPMLERVILRLCDSGFSRIVVNIHHFGEQITEFLSARQFPAKISISDERDRLLDTGGGILHAERFLTEDDEPFLVHNVDILSNADLGGLMRHHKEQNNRATLLVSNRASSRRLLFSPEGLLCGWTNTLTGEYKPENFTPTPEMKALAFSGIHVLSTDFFDMARRLDFQGSFPIMDFYLRAQAEGGIAGFEADELHLIDIGKPETLARACKEVLE